ncbi:hypothetical protein EGT07_12650 [Herbaspirillum sp. HC18]|nr:hypothetical protein EGT07_12650 [Herbaspirillum sp. HC18]
MICKKAGLSPPCNRARQTLRTRCPIPHDQGFAVWRKLLIACMTVVFALEAFGIERDAGPEPESLQRLALVIGNGSYANAPLGNPANDAQAMRDTLRNLGFEVMHYENLDRARMEEAVGIFSRRLERGGVGLFYFSGHGFRVGDRTLLAPIDVDRDTPASLMRKGIDLQSVLDRMSAPRPGKRNLLVLDTCLNNPFGGPSADFPLAPAHTTIAYATAPGAIAGDGTMHGLFTAALLDALRMPEADPMNALRRAAEAARLASDQHQSPAIVSSLAVDAVIAPTRTGMTGTGGRAILPKDSAEQYELTFWESIKDSKDIGDYEAYLQAYPKGRFASLAKSRIERLRAAAKQEAPAESKPAPAPKAAEPEKPRAAPKAATERPKPAPPPPPKAEQPAPAEPPAKPAAKVARGSEIRDCAACPVLISLPPGSFTMGSNSGDPSEKPAHHVSIGAPFAIGKYEVTVEQWNACIDGGGCPRISSTGAPNTPIRDVSWDDAQGYVKWLANASGKPYRLPTEAEWEYAARAGTSTRFWWGDQMRTGYANCKDCGDPWSADGPAPVGSFAPNPFGLHDVNGSVWEWVADCWHTHYNGAPANGSAWDAQGCRERVIRGGSWRDGASYMPSSTRFKYGASVRHSQNGFRVARDMK